MLLLLFRIFDTRAASGKWGWVDYLTGTRFYQPLEGWEGKSWPHWDLNSECKELKKRKEKNARHFFLALMILLISPFLTQAQGHKFEGDKGKKRVYKANSNWGWRANWSPAEFQLSNNNNDNPFYWRHKAWNLAGKGTSWLHRPQYALGT